MALSGGGGGGEQKQLNMDILPLSLQNLLKTLTKLQDVEVLPGLMISQHMNRRFPFSPNGTFKGDLNGWGESGVVCT